MILKHCCPRWRKKEPNRVRQLGAWLGLSVALAAGCADDFDAYTLLSTPRVLAIQSAPARLGFADAPAGEPMTSAQLLPKVFLPEGYTAAYTWSWCPFVGDPTDGFVCPIDVEAPFIDGQVLPSPLTPQNDGAAQLNTDAWSFAASQGICQAALQGLNLPAIGALPSCDDGLDILVRLRMAYEGPLPEDAGVLEAVRRIQITPKSEDLQQANPSLIALRIAEQTPQTTPAPGEDPDPAWEDNAVVVPDESTAPAGSIVPIQVVAGATYRLWVDLPNDARELYVPEVEPNFFSNDGSEPTDGTDLVYEDIVVTWFAGIGDMDISRTIWRDPDDVLAKARTNTWTLPPERAWEELGFAGGMVPIVLVVRDNRGGVSWIERMVDVVATR